jgi:Flp pilus assembly pilin Flp
MSRSVPAMCGCVIALLLLRVPASGQTAVEAGLAGSASSTGAAGAGQGLKKAIGGVFDKLNETVNGKGAATVKTDSPAKSRPRQGSAGKAVPAREQATAAAVAAKPSYEDAMEIQKGTGYEELVRRFGPPALQIANGNGQTMSYISNGGVVQLELQGGTVVSVSKPKSGA